MTYTEKFLSDIARAAKRERAENGSRYDAKKTCERIARSLENAIRGLGGLPRAVGDYWLTEYIVEEYHHGRIFVKQSEPGKGTTFRIELKK